MSSRFIDFSDPVKAVNEAEAIVVGGGNTWNLLRHIHDLGLIEADSKEGSGGNKVCRLERRGQRGMSHDHDDQRHAHCRPVADFTRSTLCRSRSIRTTWMPIPKGTAARHAKKESGNSLRSIKTFMSPDCAKDACFLWRARTCT